MGKKEEDKGDKGREEIKEGGEDEDKRPTGIKRLTSCFILNVQRRSEKLTSATSWTIKALPAS